MASIIAIYYHYSAQKLILILPSHGVWKAESTYALQAVAYLGGGDSGQYSHFAWTQKNCWTKNGPFWTKHTHNRFTALLDFVRDYLGEPAPER